MEACEQSEKGLGVGLPGTIMKPGEFVLYTSENDNFEDLITNIKPTLVLSTGDGDCGINISSETFGSCLLYTSDAADE